MSDYADLVKGLRTLSNHPESWFAEAADAIEALIRERDELDFLKWEGGEESIGREIEKARALGYREGLEKAADWLALGECADFADAIRALIPE